VVVDDDWPVGVFTQVEALECRDLARGTAVEEVMNPGMVCMPESTKIFRAAQQAIAMRVRRIIAVKKREMVGIIGGLDFAGFAAS
jgi:predicted transcriptional regulator